jgi:hypothetical protein
MPTFQTSADQLRQGHLLTPGVGASQQPSRGEQFHKSMHVWVSGKKRPIEPSGLIVLTIRIIVAVLCPPDFIAHHKHWQTKREASEGQEILYLTVSKLFSSRVIGGPFGSTVPTSIVVCAVAVAFSVRFVVLLIV